MSTLTYPDDPADDYLSVAFHLIQEAQAGPAWFKNFPRQCIMVSCISSFVSLEAAINRLYYETFQSHEHSIKTSLSPPEIAHFSKQWRLLSIKDKYIRLPPLISDPRFEFSRSDEPFSFFCELVTFRNSLVHPRMIERFDEIIERKLENGSVVKQIFSQRTAAPDRKETYPLTNFATTFKDLTISDAEIAFEIAVRMRLVLSFRLDTLSPCVSYKKSDSSIEIGVEGPELGKLISLHFGALPNGT